MNAVQRFSAGHREDDARIIVIREGRDLISRTGRERDYVESPRNVLFDECAQRTVTTQHQGPRLICVKARLVARVGDKVPQCG